MKWFHNEKLKEKQVTNIATISRGVKQESSPCPAAFADQLCAISLPCHDFTYFGSFYSFYFGGPLLLPSQ